MLFIWTKVTMSVMMLSTRVCITVLTSMAMAQYVSSVLHSGNSDTDTSTHTIDELHNKLETAIRENKFHSKSVFAKGQAKLLYISGLDGSGHQEFSELLVPCTNHSTYQYQAYPEFQFGKCYFASSIYLVAAEQLGMKIPAHAATAPQKDRIDSSSNNYPAYLKELYTRLAFWKENVAKHSQTGIISYWDRGHVGFTYPTIPSSSSSSLRVNPEIVTSPNNPDMVPFAVISEHIGIDLQIIVLIREVKDMLRSVYRDKSITIQHLIAAAKELARQISLLDSAFYICVDTVSLSQLPRVREAKPSIPLQREAPEEFPPVLQSLRESINPGLYDIAFNDMLVIMKTLSNKNNSFTDQEIDVNEKYAEEDIAELSKLVDNLRQICNKGEKERLTGSEGVGVGANARPPLYLKPLKFLHVTKTAGSTIEALSFANKYSWGKHDIEYGWWHGRLMSRASALQRTYDWFLVARNPYTRCISEFVSDHWHDKGKDRANNTYFNNHLSRHLDAVLLPTDSIVNGEHFTPASWYLQGVVPGVKVHVLRFENLEEEFNALMDKYFIPMRWGNVSDGLHASYRFGIQNISTEVADKIKLAYQSDFENFNYSTDIRNAVFH